MGHCRGQENLCHYVRVVLFWGPFTWLAFSTPFRRRFLWVRPWMILATVAAASALAVGFVVAPVGTLRVVVTGLAVALVLAAVVGAIVGGFMLVGWAKERRRARRLARLPGSLLDAVDKVDKGDGIVVLVLHFLAAKKAKVCPFITIEDR